MNASDRKVDLRSFYPFNCCDDALRARALSLGKCVSYTTGESVLLNGSPAKHCGVIIEGQAVAFKTDSSGKRYQLCLDEGCFIGLEVLESGSTYTQKVTAASDLEVFFWNTSGISQLCEDSYKFADALKIMNEGRLYQEQWLLPETDITDPVLCSTGAHWLSIIAPGFIILPALGIGLYGCSLMVRRYPVTWLLIFFLLFSAGILLYRKITKRFNERIIITAKNAIHVPQNEESPMEVLRLYRLQSVGVRQNIFGKLVDTGKIELKTDEQKIYTPLISRPLTTAALIKSFAEKASLGRKIPLTAGKEKINLPAQSRAGSERHTVTAGSPRIHYHTQAEPFGENQSVSFVSQSDDDSLSAIQFQAIEFRAHWALLVKMLLKPFLLMAACAAGYHFFRNFSNLFFIIFLFCIIWSIYQFITWKNHRFIIEEDCVRDCSRKPLTNEDQNLAMNHRIQSVRYTKKGFFQNLLNYGTVYIMAGEGELSFDYVSDPKYVQEQIKQTCSRYESKRFFKD